MAEAAELLGDFKIVGFLDDSLSVVEEIWGVPMLGAVNSMANHRSVCDQVIVAIENNAVRELLIQADSALGYGVKIAPKTILVPGKAVDAETDRYKNG